MRQYCTFVQTSSLLVVVVVVMNTLWTRFKKDQETRKQTFTNQSNQPVVERRPRSSLLSTPPGTPIRSFKPSTKTPPMIRHAIAVQSALSHSHSRCGRPKKKKNNRKCSLLLFYLIVTRHTDTQLKHARRPRHHVAIAGGWELTCSVGVRGYGR